MNREEILAKSRAEKTDEGMQQAENRGRRIGVSAFCCVYVFIVIFNFVQGYPQLWVSRHVLGLCGGGGLSQVPVYREQGIFWPPRLRGRWPARFPRQLCVSVLR